MIFPLLLIIGLSTYGFLAIRFPRIALPLFFALLPTYLIRISIGPLPTTFLELCFWMLFCGWIIRKITDKTDANILDMSTRRLCAYLGLIALIILATSVWISSDIFASIGLWRAYILEPLLFGIMLRYLFYMHPDLRLQSLLALAMSATLITALGIAQYITGFGIPAPWDNEMRITSIFPYPNALGLFLAPILTSLIIFAYTTWKIRAAHERYFLIASCTLITLGIILAKTEAALVAIPASCVIILLLSPHTSLRAKKSMGIAIALCILLAISLAPVRQKLLLQDYSGQVRISQWKETLALLTDHPITGAGMGNYPSLMREYHTAWEYEIFQYPHNILLNVWVEMGFMGVLVLLIGSALLAKNAWQHREEPLVLASSAALLTMLIHGLVDVPFFKNDLALLTVFFILIILERNRSRT